MIHIRIPRKKDVIVLGAGPAGLLAAWAAVRSGRRVTVYTSPDPLTDRPRKSDLFGCQYLHASIPGLTYTIDGMPVSYNLDGPSEGYRAKVYGDAWQGKVSPDEYGNGENHRAWDLRAAYDKLWDRFLPDMKPFHLTPGYVENARGELREYITISTVPAPALCLDMENHRFSSQDVWAMGTTGPEHALPYTAPDFTVECNGHRDTAWYRAATVFGYSTLEWPGGRKPPIAGVAPVSKPLSTDCTCHTGKGWHRLGRYGEWRKGVLVHEVFERAMDILK